MGCSKDAATNYLKTRGLVKENMEITTALPTERLTKAIDYLTNLAKTKYDVNMGDLFAIKFREIEVGNYLTMGRQSVVTKVRLEPNEPAFDAVDRSPKKEAMHKQAEIDAYRQQLIGQVTAEYNEIQKEGNFVVTEDGEVKVPNDLPQINIQC